MDDMMGESHQNFLFDRRERRKENGFPLRPQSSKPMPTKGVHMLGQRNNAMQYRAPHRLSVKSLTINKADEDGGEAAEGEANPLSTGYDGAAEGGGALMRVPQTGTSTRAPV